MYYISITLKNLTDQIIRDDSLKSQYYANITTTQAMAGQAASHRLIKEMLKEYCQILGDKTFELRHGMFGIIEEVLFYIENFRDITKIIILDLRGGFEIINEETKNGRYNE